MRRSCAPSMKRPLVNIKPPEQSLGKFSKQATVVTSNIEADPVMVELLNSSENHAHALKASSKIRKLRPPNKNDSEDKYVLVRFTVVYGKISTRKHKTWEGDGTLELIGRCATLRDEEGKTISSTNGIRLEDVEEGSRLVVGSKELEIIEKIVDSDTEGRNNSNVNQLSPAHFNHRDRSFKPPKTSQNAASLILSTNSNVQTSFKSVGTQKLYGPIDDAPDEFIPLLMPTPSFEHQWKHNKNKVPLSEVSVPYCLAKHLRPHQRDGVKFLYKCIMGYTLHDHECFGAILADEMGLGKTLQCISAIYTLLRTGPYGQTLAKRVLIVTPSSLVVSWNLEFSKWLGSERIFTFIVGPNNKLKKYAQSPHIPILIISYEMLAKQIADLESVKFDLMVCDEGHRLKNSNIRVFSVIDNIDCKCRILLTGTPIQNDLQEFYSLINFVNPGLLGSYSEFKSKYETPIVQLQQPNILPQLQEHGNTRLDELNQITSVFVLRRTQEINNKYLPEKQEVVIFVHPSALQQKLLHMALENNNQSGAAFTSPLQLITILKKICNHPSLIATKTENDPESLTKLLNDHLPVWTEMGPADSGKVGILEVLLERLIERREKVVIVSYYSKTLDMITGLCEYHNYKFCRLDGSTPSNDRCKIVSSFNSSTSDIFIMLLSAKAGGAGLNLVGASRLVLFDNDWNPASDLQAMSRIWRDGQTRPVYIYRLITAYSIEEKIYQRQISKTSLSGTVIDQKQNLNNLKFSDEDLKDLFSTSICDDDCLTHQLLSCTCQGTGDVPEFLSTRKNDSDSSGESRFQLRIKKTQPIKSQRSMKMQELMRWEHHRTPIRLDVLEELLLVDSLEDYVFVSQ
ncbi:DNA repair and recombination protein RAD54B-like [Wyeomyia smithii]|uniref:DNA repair and recombination protein RAD54B-like n=1 Tax=Wyeomyia smithii TaxID=174621 RepID=UPI002467DB5F|nr:DNA repair and recombination protein RAD54B-like [Wyeomyia smithii]